MCVFYTYMWYIKIWTSHVSNIQLAQVASSYHLEQHRYKMWPLPSKTLQPSPRARLIHKHV